MPQPHTRNKTRKRQSQRRRPKREREVIAAAHSKRNEREMRRALERARVPEMPEEQARQRGGRRATSVAIAVSPTGTRHRPIKPRTPRVVRSRAKSPAAGRQKQGRTAKRRRALSGRAEQRAGIGRR